MSSLVSPWIPRASLLTTPSKFPKFQSYPQPPASSSSSSSSSCFRVVCRAGSNSQLVGSDLKFVLHEALESSGIDTSHARDAREGFCTQIQNLSDIERETSITINRCIDLGKTALYIAAEDDSLVSHSSVPLPVDAFIERLDDLSVGYCSQYNTSYSSSPEKLLESLERYLYATKGFRRTHSRNQSEPRALYLHSVLTHRSGSVSILSLIYSELLKMLRLWGLVNFDVEIFFPHDLHSLPRGYVKQKSKESDQQHIVTSQTLLVEILKNLKYAFWPFQHDHTRSLFLWAAHAANCIDKPNIAEGSGFQLASAKAAQHRLERGVWTSVRFGDMRRALSKCKRDTQFKFEVSFSGVIDDSDDIEDSDNIDHDLDTELELLTMTNALTMHMMLEIDQDRLPSDECESFRMNDYKLSSEDKIFSIASAPIYVEILAIVTACERLILLDTDAKELRDYSILLYHCGFYQQSLQYLKLYQEAKDSSLQKQLSDSLSTLEEDAVEKLMIRLNLISMEEGWSKSSYFRNYLGNNSEPW